MTSHPEGCYKKPEKMNRANGYVIIYLVSMISFCATEALNISAVDGDGKENGTEADGGGSVPLVLTKVSQIIAREGNCALIDCNITGDPFPNIQWCNSHGHLLDTEKSGKFTVKITFRHQCVLIYHWTYTWSLYTFI